MTKAKDSASIVSIKIKNFLSITDVEIQPSQVNQIVGQNNQGKTTVLKALEWAIKGEANGSLVKNGEEAAEVIVELSDSTTIKRRVTAAGNQTVKVQRDGFEAKQPQSLLDALFDGVAFNPLTLLDPKRRNDVILQSIDLKVTPEMLAAELGVEVDKLPPLDFSLHGLKVLEQCHKYYYQRRAEANKDAADKKKRWQTYAGDLPAKVEIENAGVLNASLEGIKVEEREIEKQLETNAGLRRDVVRAAERVLSAKKQVEVWDSEIEKLTAQIAIIEGKREESIKALASAEKEVPKEPTDDSTLVKRAQELQSEAQAIRVRLETIEKGKAIEKQHEMVAGMECEFNAADAFAEALTNRVDLLAGPIKAKVMASAEMPVKGLTYTSAGFLVDGVAVDNLSASKTIGLAIGVARKLSKRTKLICIDGAEALDKESYTTLRKEINGDGYTYFLTKVGEAFPATDLRRVDQVITMNEGRVQ